MYRSVVKLKSKRTYSLMNVIKAVKKLEGDDFGIKLGDVVIKKSNIDSSKFTTDQINSTEWQIVVPDTKLLEKFRDGKKLKPEEMRIKLNYLKEKYRELELANCMDSDSCPYMRTHTDDNGWMTCPDNCRIRMQKVTIYNDVETIITKLHPEFTKGQLEMAISRYV